jgi:hypothetical protein
MKILFALLMGVLFGWGWAAHDHQGQMALERHQLRLEKQSLYQVSTSQVEKKVSSPRVLFRWPW